MSCALIIGASGGIGRAFVTAIAARNPDTRIHALSRHPGPLAVLNVQSGFIDITDEESIRSAAKQIETAPDLIVIATGILHDQNHMPERALRHIEGPAMARMFAVNTIGPALVLKHFAPLLPRDRRSVFALLSARVGSISDNRSGGWYSYRASKAALNMIVRSAAIEISRRAPQAVCVALHPGTVDTALSKPFQERVVAEQLFTPAHSVERLLTIIDGLTSADTGRCYAWDGSLIEP